MLTSDKARPAHTAATVYKSRSMVSAEDELSAVLGANPIGGGLYSRYELQTPAVGASSRLIAIASVTYASSGLSIPERVQAWIGKNVPRTAGNGISMPSKVVNASAG